MTPGDVAPDGAMPGDMEHGAARGELPRSRAATRPGAVRGRAGGRSVNRPDLGVRAASDGGEDGRPAASAMVARPEAPPPGLPRTPERVRDRPAEAHAASRRHARRCDAGAAAVADVLP